MLHPYPQILTDDDLKILQFSRARDAHKGCFGHVLVIGGDYGMAGAVRMAGEAAARVGSGLVSVATRPEHISIICSTRPELLCYGIQHSDQIIPLLEKASIIVLGPGLGKSNWSRELFKKALSFKKLMVIDADGLNLLTHHARTNDQWVLTPHPGEAARLLQKTVQEVQLDRISAVEELQKLYLGTIVLKGAGTLIKGNELWQCHAGNPGMASGGMGDVLSGIIAGLLAQGLSLIDAARCGVYLHAKAADQAALQGERGLLAMDVIHELRKWVN